MSIRAFIFLLLLGASPCFGDTVYMLDGSIREGLVEMHNATELHLRIERDGIAGTLVIPLSQISRAVITHRAPEPTPPALLSDPTVTETPSGLPPPPLGPDPFANATSADYTLYRDHGRLLEFASSFAGHGLDDLARLPPSARALWIRAAQADQARRGDTLDTLRALEATMRNLPDGIARLDAISRRERKEAFGVWMGRVHWESLGNKTVNGQFDLSDVREVERRSLIGFLKEKTGPSLEPLKQFFPPADDRTGQYGAFKVSQLQNISSGNALDVKDKATYAAAILLAQIRLEPGMPPVDKGILYNQLIIVNRIRSRAQEMESLARAAVARAEQERRAAEEKARRDAAIQASKPRPK